MFSDINCGEFDRRSFIRLIILCSAYPALSGCARIFPNHDPGNCSVETTSGKLIIDMHCHLMNLRDLNRESFVGRRFANTDEEKGLLDAFSSLGTWLVSLPGYWFTKSASSEYQWLLAETERLQIDPQMFCDLAAKEQAGFFFPKDDKQKTGFFSNRTRLAARMMYIFPEVDIFTPSMVDFAEGNWEKYSYPGELVHYYKQLNIASNGRFLPLVSFSPERSYQEIKGRWDGNEKYIKNLELVKYAIKELGFVGVKLHPSSGFSPIKNEEYGCPNTSGQTQKELHPDQAVHYNEILMELFEYCRSADVPILIHSGTGISAYRNCMEKMKGDDPSKWTNSPDSWSLALDKLNRNNLTSNDWKLRICLAHFAGAFCRNGIKDKKAGGGCKENNDTQDHDTKELQSDKKDLPPTGEPHPWLLQAARAAAKHEGVYVDLADVAEWFGKNKGRYKELFENFIDSHEELAKKMMYGTDWHMPTVAQQGHKYLLSVQDFLPDKFMDSAMGLNAVDFYGLAEGRDTRKRLEVFYDRHGLDLNKIPWMSKVDILS